MNTRSQYTSDVDETLRQAVIDVVQIWLQRLQLVSSITTFFASVDALLFSLASTATHTGGDASSNKWTAVNELTSASLAGALIFHVCSAIIAFVAAFVLCRFELVGAQDHERVVIQNTFNAGTVRGFEDLHEIDHHPRPSENSIFKAPVQQSNDTPSPQKGRLSQKDVANDVFRRVAIHCVRPPRLFPVFVAPDSLELGAMSVGHPKDTLDPPVQLLSRCLALSVVMAGLGFALALLGILAYSWTMMPKSVSIFSVVCLGVCCLASALAVL